MNDFTVSFTRTVVPANATVAAIVRFYPRSTPSSELTSVRYVCRDCAGMVHAQPRLTHKRRKTSLSYKRESATTLNRKYVTRPLKLRKKLSSCATTDLLFAVRVRRRMIVGSLTLRWVDKPISYSQFLLNDHTVYIFVLVLRVETVQIHMIWWINIFF